VIGHLKNHGHLGRCISKAGDAANAILSAGRPQLLLAWLKELLLLILLALLDAHQPQRATRSTS